MTDDYMDPAKLHRLGTVMSGDAIEEINDKEAFWLRTVCL